MTLGGTNVKVKSSRQAGVVIFTPFFFKNRNIQSDFSLFLPIPFDIHQASLKFMSLNDLILKSPWYLKPTVVDS